MRNSQHCKILGKSVPGKCKMSVEVGGSGVSEEPEADSVAREKHEVTSRDKQYQTVGRSLKYISIIGSH